MNDILEKLDSILKKLDQIDAASEKTERLMSRILDNLQDLRRRVERLEEAA